LNFTINAAISRPVGAPVPDTDSAAQSLAVRPYTAKYASNAPRVFHCSHSVAFKSYAIGFFDFSSRSTSSTSPLSVHLCRPDTSPGWGAMLCTVTGLFIVVLYDCCEYKTISV